MTELTKTAAVTGDGGAPNTAIAQARYYIYGKHSSQSRFRPMDLHKQSRVVNLIFASRLTEEEVTRFFEVEAPRNTDWTFKRRRIAHTPRSAGSKR